MYNKTNWVDNSAPYINADALNKIENGIYDNTVEDTGWIDLKPFLVNGWVEYNQYFPIRARNINGLITLEGLVGGGTSAVVFSNLPESIHPIFSKHIRLSHVGGSMGIYFNSIGGYEFRETYSTVWSSIDLVVRKD